jgi:penicillin V acylase-like amidase (Ntn superfamily)
MSLAAVLACTAFVLGDAAGGPVVGKSYDWHMGHGMVVVNKRGVAKRALVLDPRDRPAAWTSRYASITFNQYGREHPNGGMNEAGLVLEVLWLDESRYPARDERPAVGELQWIQMQLDRFATVAEVAAAAAETRVVSEAARVHYLACDATAACVAVELLDGEVVVAPARALANDPHARSAAFLARQRDAPSGRGSLQRFARASLLAGGPDAGDRVAAALDVLARVSQGDYSQWNVVYEPARRRVSWRTLRSPMVKTASLGAFELACGAPALTLDIDHPLPGDVAARFAPYEPAKNRALVERSLAGMKLPPGAGALLAAYPATTRCQP